MAQTSKILWNLKFRGTKSATKRLLLSIEQRSKYTLKNACFEFMMNINGIGNVNFISQRNVIERRGNKNLIWTFCCIIFKISNHTKFHSLNYWWLVFEVNWVVLVAICFYYNFKEIMYPTLGLQVENEDDLSKIRPRHERKMIRILQAKGYKVVVRIFTFWMNGYLGSDCCV